MLGESAPMLKFLDSPFRFLDKVANTPEIDQDGQPPRRPAHIDRLATPTESLTPPFRDFAREPSDRSPSGPDHLWHPP
jgi:hypothetical protein